MNVHPIAPRIARTPTIVALHSSGGSGRQWASLVGQARSFADVIAPDFHGHGSAPAWRGDDTDIVSADTARIATIVARVPGGVHLVGHSYGGAIALRVALRHPEYVQSVSVYEPVAFRVLFDHDGRRRPAAEVLELARSIRRHLGSHRRDLAARTFVDYWGGAGSWAALSLERRASQSSRMPVIAAHFFALAGDMLRRRDYANLRAPILYLSGRETRPATLRIAELLACTLPQARHERMHGMDHLGPITHAGEVAARITSFVGGIADSQPSVRELRAA